MSKITKTLMTMGLALGGLAGLTAGPALAQEVELSANTAFVSDYRFRGVSLSDEDVAIQGGLDAAYQGFYVGSWASSIDSFNGSEAEVDLYDGWSGPLGDSGVNLDLGALAYVYPGGTGTDYYEFYGSVGGTVQMVDWTLGAAYNPDQDNIGDDDNIYIYGDLGFAIPDTPLSLGGHLGYEDGAFSRPNGSAKWDWSLSLGVDVRQFTVSVAYVDTNMSGDASDATAVVSVGAAF